MRLGKGNDNIRKGVLHLNNELEKLALEKANLTSVFEKERDNLEYLRTQVSEKKTEVSAKTNEIR